MSLAGPIIKDLDGCAKPKEKRSLTLALKLAQIVALGVTDFVKSRNSKMPESKEEESLIMHMADQVRSITNTFVTDRTKLVPYIIRQLESVSPTAQNHRFESDLFAQQMPNAIWGTMHIESEILAGLANLKTIHSYCVRKRLATKR